MKQIKVNAYTYDELDESAKERVLNEWVNKSSQDIFQIHLEEIFDSYKLFVESTGFKLKDFSIDAYSQYIVLDHEYDEEIYSMSGKRAIAWLENNVLSQFRVSHKERYKNLKQYRKYGDTYKAGAIKGCPFTGYCFDEIFLTTFIYAISNDLLSIAGAFYEVERKLNILLRENYEFVTSEEYLKEYDEANGLFYTKKGNLIYS